MASTTLVVGPAGANRVGSVAVGAMVLARYRYRRCGQADSVAMP
jgi:hypothetical protein